MFGRSSAERQLSGFADLKAVVPLSTPTLPFRFAPLKGNPQRPFETRKGTAAQFVHWRSTAIHKKELSVVSEEQISAKVSVLVRKSVREVFATVTDPVAITKFWLARASGPLELGHTVQWDFMVPGSSVETTVTGLETDKLITISWSDGTTVKWIFDPHAFGTHLTVENSGFDGSHMDVVKAALEATQGFTIVLCDLKTLLERGHQMDLSRDKAVLIEERQKAAERH